MKDFFRKCRFPHMPEEPNLPALLTIKVKFYSHSDLIALLVTYVKSTSICIFKLQRMPLEVTFSQRFTMLASDFWIDFEYGCKS